MTQPKSNNSGFATLVLVFFFWGFVAASNDILIPVFKEHLKLAQWQSQMVSFAFYVAYTAGAVWYQRVSRWTGGDLLNRMGYKKGIALGLGISALGTMLFYPAAETSSFALFITGLFIVGLGFSLQQIAANPLAVNLGDPAKGSQRLSLAGGVNNVGTTIGPVVVSLAIFGTAAGATLKDLSAVKTPYLILGAAFLAVAALILFSSLPDQIGSAAPDEKEQAKDTRSIFSYRQLWMGMIAIFLYVGVEVSTASNLPEFLRQHLHIGTDQVSPYVSLFWASLMIGRWTGAVGAFDVSDGLKKVLGIVLPYAAFGVFLLVNAIAGRDLSPFYIYAAILPLVIIGNMLTNGKPARQLLLYSALGIAALIIGMLADGIVSVYAFISVGLFCSTLWPCIFTLGITGLGSRTNDASSYLIMMIMGGGFVSVFQGWLSDPGLLGIQMGYIVGVVCFAYLAFYGWQMRSLVTHAEAVPVE
ncbi:MAG: MFS transporter [Bacteroidetes bacterium]|nr:MFS transporter [Bacteroidota bacterium]